MMSLHTRMETTGPTWEKSSRSCWWFPSVHSLASAHARTGDTATGQLFLTHARRFAATSLDVGFSGGWFGVFDVFLSSVCWFSCAFSPSTHRFGHVLFQVSHVERGDGGRLRSVVRRTVPFAGDGLVRGGMGVGGGFGGHFFSLPIPRPRPLGPPWRGGGSLLRLGALSLARTRRNVRAGVLV